jgi:two-component system, LytTR family, response regulator
MRNNVVCILTIFVSSLSLIGQDFGSTPKLDLNSTLLEDTWRPIISMPWVTYGSDFGGVAGWHTSGISSDSRIDPLFDRLEQNGVAAVVWFLFGDGRGALTFDPSGYVTGVVPSFWADYHTVLAAAERHHLRVVWVLTDFEMGMPVQVERGVQKRGRADLLEDPAKRHSLIKEALEPILKDKTASGQVAGWIVINEPEHLLRSGYVTDSAVRAFVTETAAEIKHYHPELECSTGSEAVEYLQNHAVDLAFLDIEMPGSSGVEVIQQLDPKSMPLFVFITAHNDFAIQAFELHALDYLLKPVQTKRLRATLARVKERFRLKEMQSTQDQLSSVLRLMENLPLRDNDYAERFLVKNGTKDEIVNVADIEWIEAADYYACLHVGRKEHLLREPIKALESKLNPRKFVRIDRSAIINLDYLKEIHRDSRIDGWAILRSGERVKMNKAGWKKLAEVSSA